MNKIKLLDIVGNVESIKLLSKIPLKANISFKISKFIKEVNVLLVNYEMKKKELFHKYGYVTEDKESYQLSPENIDKYLIENSQLLEEEIDIESPKLKESDFEGKEFPAIIIVDLKYMFVEEVVNGE